MHADILKCDLEATGKPCQSFKNHFSALLQGKIRATYGSNKQPSYRRELEGGEEQQVCSLTMERLEGCSRAQRGCCEDRGQASSHLLTDPPCLLSLQPSSLACPHPSTCTAADLYSFFFFCHVVMTGQTAVLSRRVSCFTSVSLSTSCSLISVWNCFLEGI